MPRNGAVAHCDGSTSIRSPRWRRWRIGLGDSTLRWKTFGWSFHSSQSFWASWRSTYIKMLSPNSRIPSLGRPGLKHLGQGGMQRILVLAADQLILLQASDVMRTPENLVALGEITNCYEMLWDVLFCILLSWFNLLWLIFYLFFTYQLYYNIYIVYIYIYITLC